MDKTFTRNEYMRILEEEKELLGSTSYDADIQSQPKNQTVNNLLSFSKAYSHQSSGSVVDIEHILN
ncbi:MAG: hypothetical protein JKX73_10435 [Flavobacteriales bacterium]|nr:hypothetical protein [Flavobacteriales bacterium]